MSKKGKENNYPTEKKILSAYETYVVTNNETNLDGSVNIASEEDVRLAKKWVDDNKK